MHAIFYSLTVVGVLACLAGGSARDVAADKAVINLLQRAVEVEGDADAHNKTIIDLLNETTTANETTVHGTLDLGHPIIAMEAFYEHSRQRIHHWMVNVINYSIIWWIWWAVEWNSRKAVTVRRVLFHQRCRLSTLPVVFPPLAPLPAHALNLRIFQHFLTSVYCLPE